MIGKRDIKMYRDSKPLNNALLKKIDYCIENSNDTRTLNFLLLIKEQYYEKHKVSGYQIKVINEIYNKIKEENDRFLDELLEEIC